MKKSQLLSALCATLFTVISVSAHASLVGRLPLTPGGTNFQAAYDNVLDITWLTDADLSGSFNWDNQVGWARGLDTANYLGFDGWRLASMSVAAGLPTGTATNVIDCSTATELACRDNELGYMFYQNMDGSFGDDKRGNQTVDGVLLTDVQYDYWSGTEYDSGNAWDFFFFNGPQSFFSKGLNGYGWAVRAGDVSAIPVPAAVWLFGSGLVGLVGIARRRKVA
jgi:hypothetical protein